MLTLVSDILSKFYCSCFYVKLCIQFSPVCISFPLFRDRVLEFHLVLLSSVLQLSPKQRPFSCSRRSCHRHSSRHFLWIDLKLFVEQCTYKNICSQMFEGADMSLFRTLSLHFQLYRYAAKEGMLKMYSELENQVLEKFARKEFIAETTESLNALKSH